MAVSCKKELKGLTKFSSEGLPVTTKLLEIKINVQIKDSMVPRKHDKECGCDMSFSKMERKLVKAVDTALQKMPYDGTIECISTEIVADGQTMVLGFQ